MNGLQDLIVGFEPAVKHRPFNLLVIQFNILLHTSLLLYKITTSVYTLWALKTSSLLLKDAINLYKKESGQCGLEIKS